MDEETIAVVVAAGAVIGLAYLVAKQKAAAVPAGQASTADSPGAQPSPLPGDASTAWFTSWGGMPN